MRIHQNKRKHTRAGSHHLDQPEENPKVALTLLVDPANLPTLSFREHGLQWKMIGGAGGIWIAAGAGAGE